MLPVHPRVVGFVTTCIYLSAVGTLMATVRSVGSQNYVVCFVNPIQYADKFISRLVFQINIGVVALVRVYLAFWFVICLEGLNGELSSSLLKQMPTV